MRERILAVACVLGVLGAGCRRADDRTDAGPGRDAGAADAGADAGLDATVPPDAAGSSDAGAFDAGTSAEDGVALVTVLERAVTIAALAAGPLVAEATQVDADGEGASDTRLRDRVENGVAGDSIVADGACVTFAWSARTATITFDGCTSEMTGLSIDGTLRLAVTYRPTTFTATFDALTIGATTTSGSVALAVDRRDDGARFVVNAALAWTDGATDQAVSLTALSLAVDAGAMATTLDGAFDVSTGATRAAGTAIAVRWRHGDCHPSSGSARFTIDGGREVVATFLPATPTDGVVAIAIPPLPAVETAVLAPCP
ncbi:MAG: hypothetical protein KF729_18280 [Sandaracinaceae bacterium]|nr:hypothetical protein [Sandaracinaceae bacterium]